MADIKYSIVSPEQKSRAQGCFLGQLIGDALGSLVEFKRAETIHELYPNGVREMEDGGTFNTIAGQPTDDSEMALALARSLVRNNKYDVEYVTESYIDWYHSGPFDCGNTIDNALNGQLDYLSQANGAMMRICPVGIFGSKYDLDNVANWAEQDAGITHPNINCINANVLFAKAIAYSIRTGAEADTLYAMIMDWADDLNIDGELMTAMRSANNHAWEAWWSEHHGWVLLAFKNSLWQLLHATNFEEAIVETIGRGGDTDTNAAICGALLGTVYGREAIPKSWISTVLNCRPESNNPSVFHPRPAHYWPIDALELVGQLIAS